MKLHELLEIGNNIKSLDLYREEFDTEKYIQKLEEIKSVKTDMDTDLVLSDWHNSDEGAFVTVSSSDNYATRIRDYSIEEILVANVELTGWVTVEEFVIVLLNDLLKLEMR